MVLEKFMLKQHDKGVLRAKPGRVASKWSTWPLAGGRIFSMPAAVSVLPLAKVPPEPLVRGPIRWSDPE